MIIKQLHQTLSCFNSFPECQICNRNIWKYVVLETKIISLYFWTIFIDFLCRKMHACSNSKPNSGQLQSVLPNKVIIHLAIFLFPHLIFEASVSWRFKLLFDLLTCGVSNLQEWILSFTLALPYHVIG